MRNFHHKEKILSEDECKDIGSAGWDWEWKLVSHLSAKSLGYTQEVVKFLEEAKFASYHLELLKSKLIWIVSDSRIQGSCKCTCVFVVMLNVIGSISCFNE